MKRSLKKWITLVLSSVLTVGAPISVSAEGAGQKDVVSVGPGGETVTLVRPEVYQVVLPTDVNGVFDFILDPQKLIEETNAAAYGGTSFEKGATMFFHRSDGQAAEEYSSSSDHVTIINRSNVPVEVQVDVNMLPESLGGISLNGDQGFTNDESASIYLALTDGEYTVPVQMEGSFIKTTLPPAPENAFEYHYDQAQNQYIYGLKSDLSNIQFPEYSFQLTGAVNEKGDWKTLGKVSPMVNVTWRVTPIHSVISDEGNMSEGDGAEQDNINQNDPEQDLKSEQSMIIKQIVETVPVEKEDDEKGGDIGQENDTSQKEDPSREEDSNQKENPSREENPNQKEDSNQNEDPSQEEDPNQNEDSGQEENLN